MYVHKLCCEMKLFGYFLGTYVFSDFLELLGSWLPFEDPIFAGSTGPLYESIKCCIYVQDPF